MDGRGSRTQMLHEQDPSGPSSGQNTFEGGRTATPSQSHKNFTSEFLNREDNSRDLLGKHWQDIAVPDQSKRRLL